MVLGVTQVWGCLDLGYKSAKSALYQVCGLRCRKASSEPVYDDYISALQSGGLEAQE
jgi:hypothetical protein